MLNITVSFDYYRHKSNDPIKQSFYANGVSAWANDGTDYDATWSEICETATNGYSANYNSDRNIKNSIEQYDDRYEILFDNLLPCRYKYNYGTSNRYHTGFVAQDIFNALQIAKLATEDFAAYICLPTENAQGSKYAIRRDEIVSLNTWQIQRCKKKISDLENTVAELKAQLQTLTAG